MPAVAIGAAKVANVLFPTLANVTLSVDDCHLIVPVFPDKVNVVVAPIAPIQIVDAPETEPVLTVVTVLMVVLEYAAAQLPL